MMAGEKRTFENVSGIVIPYKEPKKVELYIQKGFYEEARKEEITASKVVVHPSYMEVSANMDFLHRFYIDFPKRGFATCVLEDDVLTCKQEAR